jgi:TonB family protein
MPLPPAVGTGDGALPVARPAVVATNAPSCATPNAEAATINVVPPDYPDSARDLQLGAVSALVLVTLDAHGALQNARIAQSSGNLAIDQAALRSARASTYSAKIANCVPVAGSYIFHADFDL